jgi:hypothetical protein
MGVSVRRRGLGPRGRFASSTAFDHLRWSTGTRTGTGDHVDDEPSRAVASNRAPAARSQSVPGGIRTHVIGVKGGYRATPHHALRPLSG